MWLEFRRVLFRSDSGFILGSLLENGYTLTDREEEAEVIVINTCCFIHDAKEESIETIIELAEHKKNDVCKILIACGCLAQRYHKEIQDEIPEVDVIIGTTAYDEIIEAINEARSKLVSCRIKDINYLPSQKTRRVYSTGTEYSYLKIAEGCDKHCTYCIIPKLRGSYRSVPMEELIDQANYLASVGVKEIIVVAQETTLYGIDLYKKNMLPELLKQLCLIEEIQWVRLLYTYPEDITEELAYTIQAEEKICNYLDMPIQHAADTILKKMGRRTSKSELLDKINMLRNIVPNIALRTTLITGFPGETQKDHEELLAFIKEVQFDRLGVFTYSEEEDTPAATFVDQIEEEVKRQRYDELMQTQQAIAFNKAQGRVGDIVNVMIEGELPDEEVYIARTQIDAPKIDGCVFMPLIGNYVTGDVLQVEITEAVGYDLLAIPTKS